MTPDSPESSIGEMWTDSDMMRGNGKISANDVEMVWEAWSHNKIQYFMEYGEIKYRKQ